MKGGRAGRLGAALATWQSITPLTDFWQTSPDAGAWVIDIAPIHDQRGFFGQR